jgi:hypothetical protein
LTRKKNKTSRKYFDEWKKEKSPFLAMSSLALAESAQDCLEFLEMFKSRRLARKIHFRSNPDQWLNLYRDHRKLYKGVTAALRNLDKESSDAVDFYEFVINSFNESKKMEMEEKRKALESLSQEELENTFTVVKESVRELEDWVIKLFRNNENEESKELTEKEIKKRAEKFFQKQEIIFFLRLYIPCVLIYGIYPVKLLWKARKGNEDAIEKLLRLDKMIIYDSKIKQIIWQTQNEEKRRKFDLMMKEIIKEPKIRLEIKRVKYSLAALISIISKAIGQNLFAPEIQKLFDAIARDKDENNLVDEDIATGESFETAIWRYREFWQIIPYEADSK